jgi:hypothetical protein
VSALEAGDRRRLVAAAITTVAALPFLLAGPGKGGTGVATIGQQANIVSAIDASTSDPQPAAATAHVDDLATPGFLIGPPPATDPAEVLIAVPTSWQGNVFEGKATYQRFASEGFGLGQPCAFGQVPPGTHVTVLDLDNGKSIPCTVFGAPRAGARADIVLDTSEFALIADLGQAPVNVRVTW